MLEIAGYILIAIAVAAAALVAYAWTKPDTFAVSRETTIAAPPEHIYPLIANLRAMNTWNPFVAPDPAIEITYSGPEIGTGAMHTWRGNRQVGQGSVLVTDAVAPSRVAMRLLMLEPMKADNAVEFKLAPNGGGTSVTWAMSGPQPLLAKVVSVIIDCDSMVGRQFEKGLASLKTIAES